MICFPNAKINLGLHVVSRRPDGYHNLETIFYPVGVKDALEVISPPESTEITTEPIRSLSMPKGDASKVRNSDSPRYRFFQSGIGIEGDHESNLVIKALKLIALEKMLPAMDIHLLKRIPFGAGLGGGSSDAAFMLRLLNEKFHLGYSEEDLIDRAAQLGADCPFFIFNRPVFATGTGNILTPIEVDLSAYSILLVKPNIMVSTKEAYAMISPKKPDLSLEEIIRKPVETWRDCLKNDFETPVFKKSPEIRNIKEQLYEMGAVYAAMSGSGSTLFALFEKVPDYNGVFSDHYVWLGNT